jgi:hypothetical protein
VEAGVQDAEDGVVAAGYDGQVLVRNDSLVQKGEDSVLGDLRGHDEAGQPRNGLPHHGPSPLKDPPMLVRPLLALADAGWLDMRLGVGKGRLEQGRVLLGHVHAEVDDPHVPRPASDVQAVEPGPNHLAVGSPVRVWRQQPLASDLAGDLERTGLLDANVGRAGVLRQSPRRRQIARSAGVMRRREVGLDASHLLAIQLHTSPRSARGKGHQRHPHRGPVVDPGLIRPGVEDVQWGA